MDPNTNLNNTKSLADFLDDSLRNLEDPKNYSLPTLLSEVDQYQKLREYFKAQPNVLKRLTLHPEDPQEWKNFATNLWAIFTKDDPLSPQTENQREKVRALFSEKYPETEALPHRKETWEEAIKGINSDYESRSQAQLDTEVKPVRGVSVKRVRQINDEFFRELHNLRAYGVPEVKEKIDALENNPRGRSFEDIRREVVELRRVAAADEQSRIDKIVTDYEPAMTSAEYVSPEQAASSIAQSVLEHVDAPPVFAATFANNVSKSKKVTPEVIDRAERDAYIELANMRGVANADKIPLQDAYPGAKEANREKVINEKYDTAYQNTVNSATNPGFVEKLTQALGEKAAESQLIKDAIKNGTQSGVQRRGGFRGFLTPTSAPDPDMETFLLSTDKPSASGYFVARTLANHPEHFHFEIGSSPLEWIFQFMEKKGAKGAVVAGAEKAGIFAVAKSWIGGPWRWAISLASVGISSFLNKVKTSGPGSVGVAGDAIGEFFKSATGAQGRNSQASQLDGGVAMFIGAVVIIAFFGVYTVQTTFMASFIPPEIGGGEPTQIVDCRTTQTNPVCNGAVIPPGVDCNASQTNPQCKAVACVPKKQGDCMWPTTGYITQGPRPTHCVVGGKVQTSHETMDALDIGAAYNTPVIAVRGGNITTWKSGCADQPNSESSKSWGCNGGWGNYIDISSPDGYVIRYGHLALQSMSLTSPGKTVPQGAQIGRVDNNGNSTGSHLHFQVVSGPGDVFSVVPLSQREANEVNHCTNSVKDGCHAACPVIHTSIN